MKEAFDDTEDLAQKYIVMSTGDVAIGFAVFVRRCFDDTATVPLRASARVANTRAGFLATGAPRAGPLRSRARYCRGECYSRRRRALA